MLDAAARPDAPAGTTRSLDRRQLLRTAAWTAPLIVVAAAVPAAAASTGGAEPVAQPQGSVPIGKLRTGDFRVENRRMHDPATQTNRGPLAVYANVFYDQSIDHQSDPATATIPWTVTVTGPLGTRTLTGAHAVAKYQFSEQLVWYPGENVFPVPAGTYTFVYTIYGANGSASAPAVEVTVS